MHLSFADGVPDNGTAYPLVVDDFDDTGQLVLIFALTDQDDTTHFHLAPDGCDDLGVAHGAGDLL